MKIKTAPKLCLLLIYLLPGLTTQGQTFDYSDGGNALFRIYIPSDIGTIRGVMHIVYWQNGDSRGMTSDFEYQMLCKEIGFALMGSKLASNNISGGAGDALLASLKAFSSLSNHPELSTAPLFFNGHSWGGQWAFAFALWKPERVVGLFTHKGGYHTMGYAGEAIHVPMYMFVGGSDLDYRKSNLTNIFNENRPKGAPWTLAVEPNAGHAAVTDNSVLFPYVRKIVSLRLPNETGTYGGVTLNRINLDDGWSGNLTTFSIANMKCFSNDTTICSWLPDKNTACIWQTFVTGGYSGVNSKILDCSEDVVMGTFQNTFASETRVYPNPTYEKLTIDLVKPCKEVNIEIRNTIGLIVGQNTFNNTAQITTRITGSKGLYLIAITNELNQKATFKIVKN